MCVGGLTPRTSSEILAGPTRPSPSLPPIPRPLGTAGTGVILGQGYVVHLAGRSRPRESGSVEVCPHACVLFSDVKFKIQPVGSLIKGLSQVM